MHIAKPKLQQTAFNTAPQTTKTAPHIQINYTRLNCWNVTVVTRSNKLYVSTEKRVYK